MCVFEIYILRSIFTFLFRKISRDFFFLRLKGDDVLVNNIPCQPQPDSLIIIALLTHMCYITNIRVYNMYH